MFAYIKTNVTITNSAVRVLVGTIQKIQKIDGGFCNPSTLEMCNYPYATLKSDWVILLPEVPAYPGDALLRLMASLLKKSETTAAPVVPSVSLSAYNTLKVSNDGLNRKLTTANAEVKRLKAKVNRIIRAHKAKSASAPSEVKRLKAKVNRLIGELRDSGVYAPKHTASRRRGFGC